MGFPCGSAGKESACNVGDLDSIPGLGRPPGERNLPYSPCSGLESMGLKRVGHDSFYFILAAPDPNCYMWDIVSWLRIEPGPPALGVWSLSKWTTGKSLKFF